MQKSICSSIVMLLLVSVLSFGADFSDDFNTNHDFLTEGVAGTGWDGFFYNAGLDSTKNTVVTTAASASGVLNLVSSNGNWEAAADDGLFLYVNVVAGANFKARVYVSSYTYVNYHDTGLMARRVPGTTENYVMGRYFGKSGYGNGFRTVTNNVAKNYSGPDTVLRPYLELEKYGSTFIYRASDDGINWIECRTLTRTDLDNVPLQVGIYQATFSTNSGDVSFDNFRMEITPLVINPVPSDGEDLVDTSTNLSWDAPIGIDFIPEGYNVHLGTDPNADDVSAYGWTGTAINPSTDMDISLDNDTTYYWRVDTLEPNTLGPATIHAGRVWSFTTFPPIPLITGDPVSDTVELGEYVTLSAEAMNAEIYTWYQSADAIADSGDTIMGTGQTIQIGVDGINKEGWYYCVVSNSVGSDASEMARIMSKRLVGYWDFEGDLNDNVTGGVPTHDGSATAPDFTAGVPGIGGQGYAFFGDGRVVAIAESNDYFNFYPQGMTISCWIKSQGSNWSAFCSKEYEREISYSAGKGFFLTKNSDGNAQFGIRPSQVESSTAIADGGWHLVTAVYDPDALVMRIYIDGVLSNQKTGVNPAAFNSPNLAPLVFGAESTDGTVNPFEGSIDDFRIWNYPLTSYSIARQYVDVMGGYVCVDNVLPAADLSGDCQVNLEDLKIIAENWLQSNRVE